MFAGGADTTVSALGTFVLAMLANPEAQKKAQAEVDSLTAGLVLPTFADRDSLPYVSAIVKEVLRWKNVAPFGKSDFLCLGLRMSILTLSTFNSGASLPYCRGRVSRI